MRTTISRSVAPSIRHGGLILLFLLPLLTGCANLNPTRSGYLSDYSHLQSKASKIPLVRIHTIESAVSDTFDLASIDSFIIEPVAWLATVTPPTSLVDDFKQNLSVKLRQSLVDELSQLKPIVDKPGPRTAKVRAAVTQVAFARPIVNSALTVVAVPMFNGGGVVEAEVVAPGDRQVASVVAALPGRAWDILGFYSWQGHAETAMQRSARELRSILSPPPCEEGELLESVEPEAKKQ